MTPPFLTSESLGLAPHGFFGREGGVSEGIYASLNCGPGSRDAPDAVAENRRRVGGALAASEPITAYQTHSAIALLVNAPFAGARPEADGLVTRARGLAIGVLTADCGPILLADAEAGVVGAAHAGWKGALGGIIEATVDLMVRAGAVRERIAAAIGPCIAQASYEVGPDLLARFAERDPTATRFFGAGVGDRLQFDLEGYCAARLAAAGLVRIARLGQDTFAQEARYFSHRRAVKRGDQDYGRNISVISPP